MFIASALAVVEKRMNHIGRAGPRFIAPSDGRRDHLAAKNAKHAKKEIGISPAKAPRRKGKKNKTPNLACFAPWREIFFFWRGRAIEKFAKR